MIVLRITARGRTREARSEKPEVVLGADAAADVIEEDVGWAPREAVLVHRGTEVELRRPDGQGDLRLRVGDAVRLGHARLALVGLLPLPEAPEDENALETSPTFGGYDEDWPAAQPFALVDELARPESKVEPKEASSLPRADAPAKPTAKKTAAAATSTSGTSAVGTSAEKRPRREGTPGTADRKGTPPLPRPPSPAFRPVGFDAEMISQLKRAPFFVLSLAVHALVFFVLTLLQVPPEAGAEQGEDGTLLASLQESADQEQLQKDDVGGLPPKTPEIDVPDIPLPKLPDDDLDRKDRPEDGDTLDALPDTEPAPFTVGTNPSLRSVQGGTGRAKKRITPGEMKKDFTGSDARSANERAADYVRAELGRGTGREGDPLRTLKRTDLLVVRGTFDHIGKVLDALRLPYTAVPAHSLALANKTPDLSRHKVIFWNCGESLPEEQRLLVTRRIRKFVSKGGFLFTTDWAIGNLLADAFTGYLATSGPGSPLPETVVDIEPAAGQAGHPLLKGVFLRGVQGRWWLEQASFDIRRRDRSVKILITSPDLQELYHRSPVVAATFRHGRGQVLHVMGHYYQEAGNLAGTVSAQRLALNFVLMRLERD